MLAEMSVGWGDQEEAGPAGWRVEGERGSIGRDVACSMQEATGNLCRFLIDAVTGQNRLL